MYTPYYEYELQAMSLCWVTLTQVRRLCDMPEHDRPYRVVALRNTGYEEMLVCAKEGYVLMDELAPGMIEALLDNWEDCSLWLSYADGGWTLSISEHVAGLLHQGDDGILMDCIYLERVNHFRSYFK